MPRLRVYTGDDYSEEETFPDAVVPPNTNFAVRMNDDAMHPTYPIGCTVFVKQQAQLNNEDVGIFNLYGEMMCRRFIKVRGKGGITLRPDNPDYEETPIPTDIEEFGIVGKVIGETGIEEVPKSRYG